MDGYLSEDAKRVDAARHLGFARTQIPGSAHVRRCPVCSALVPNARDDIRRHVRFHRRCGGPLPSAWFDVSAE